MLIVVLKFLQRGGSCGTAESSCLGFQYSFSCDGLSYHGNHGNQGNRSSEVKSVKR